MVIRFRCSCAVAFIQETKGHGPDPRSVTYTDNEEAHSQEEWNLACAASSSIFWALQSRASNSTFRAYETQPLARSKADSKVLGEYPHAFPRKARSIIVLGSSAGTFKVGILDRIWK